MNGNALKQAAGAGDRVVHKLVDSRDAVTDAFEEGQAAVRKLVKRSRRTVEDMLDDTTHTIKRNPLGSVAIAFAAGALIGLVVASATVGRR